MDGPELPPAPPIPPSEQPPPSGGSGRLILIGLASGLGLYVLGFLLSISGGVASDGYWALGVLIMMIALTTVLIIAAIVLVIIGKTRQFAIGLFIGIGVGLLVDGGVCIGLLQATVA